MNHGSLFSGIGGFDLSADWVGWTNIFQVENDKFCNKILEKNFPKVKRYGDIKEFNAKKYKGIVDILTAGVPCQPASLAGKRNGTEDDRWLWPEVIRVVRECQPTWCCFENVRGLITLQGGMVFKNILVEMETIGYSVQPFIIPSAGIGAWDKRERVWIIAYVATNPKKSRDWKLSIQQRGQNETKNINLDRQIKINTDTNKFDSDNAGFDSGAILQQQTSKIQINKDITSIGCKNGISGKKQNKKANQCNHRFKRNDWWQRNWVGVASEFCRDNARVPNKLDRIKALGNSVNPYVVREIFKAINEIEKACPKPTE